MSDHNNYRPDGSLHAPVFPRTVEQARDMLARAHFSPEYIEKIHIAAYLKASDRAENAEHYERIYCATCYALGVS
jgi:hypothetical protein